MRAQIAAGLIALLVVGVGFDALAQITENNGLGQQRQSIADQVRNQGQGQTQGQPKGPPPRQPPPPITRCPDLAIGDTAIGAIAPDTQPLGANEVSVRFEVRNAGGAAYAAADSTQQALVLEYVTPGGPQQIIVRELPPGVAAPTTQTANLAPGVTLGPGQSWRGYLRATVPPEAVHRPLRLKIVYAAHRGPVNDCDMDNNTAPLRR